MKPTKANNSRALALAASMGQLAEYPFREEAREALARGLVDAFPRIEDAEAYVRDVLRRERVCPKVADIFAFTNLSAAAKWNRKTKDCPHCDGTGYQIEYYLRTHLRNAGAGEKRHTTERITVEQAMKLTETIRDQWQAHDGDIRKAKAAAQAALRSGVHGEAALAPPQPNQEVIDAVRRCSCLAA